MVDTTLQFANVIIPVLGIVANGERARFIERTSAGRQAASLRPVKSSPGGDRPAPHQQLEALQRLAAGDTQRTVAASLRVD
jgi:DNA invertase Pin-like site-specific DNA recombinase